MEGVGAARAKACRPVGSERAQGGPGGQQGQREMFGFGAKSMEDAVLSQGPCLSFHKEAFLI